MKTVLLIDENKLKRDSYLDANIDNNILRVAIAAVQDIVIEDVLGTCLYEDIKASIVSCSIDSDTASHYRFLLDDYISKIFIYGVPAELNIPISYKQRNSGTVRIDTDTTNNPSLNELQYTHNWYLKKRDFYITRAINFLRCSDCYIKCKCGKCWCGKKPLQHNYSIGLSLNISNVNRRK